MRTPECLRNYFYFKRFNLHELFKRKELNPIEIIARFIYHQLACTASTNNRTWPERSLCIKKKKKKSIISVANMASWSLYSPLFQSLNVKLKARDFFCARFSVNSTVQWRGLWEFFGHCVIIGRSLHLLCVSCLTEATGFMGDTG